MKLWIAAISAVAVQPLVLAARIAPDLFGSKEPMYGVGFFLIAVVAVAAAATLLIGIPVFLALRKFQRDGWTSLGVAGFLTGALPFVFSWPSRMEGYSSGQNWHGKYVALYIDGTPTKYAWLTYAENLALFGLHGSIGALVFYAVWRRLDRTQPLAQPSEA
jgi:hypothetical protein